MRLTSLTHPQLSIIKILHDLVNTLYTCTVIRVKVRSMRVSDVQQRAGQRVEIATGRYCDTNESEMKVRVLCLDI